MRKQRLKTKLLIIESDLLADCEADHFLITRPKN